MAQNIDFNIRAEFESLKHLGVPVRCITTQYYGDRYNVFVHFKPGDCTCLNDREYPAWFARREILHRKFQEVS